MKEVSAGAVVFRKENGKNLFLLLHYPTGHWDFVKGKIEEGESLLETVTREAKEETGITDLNFFDSFREEIEYSFTFEGNVISKKVIFFLAETKTKKIVISHEHLNYVWLEFQEAINKITYDNARGVLIKANDYLQRQT